MEFDIFKRKLVAKGFSIIKKNGDIACYKNILLGQKDYTLESSELTKKKVFLYVYKLSTEKDEEGCYPDILVAAIRCRGIGDLDSAIKEIENLMNGTVEAPFDKLMTEENISIGWHRGRWMVTGKCI